MAMTHHNWRLRIQKQDNRKVKNQNLIVVMVSRWKVKTALTLESWQGKADLEEIIQQS